MSQDLGTLRSVVQSDGNVKVLFLQTPESHKDVTEIWKAFALCKFQTCLVSCNMYCIHRLNAFYKGNIRRDYCLFIMLLLWKPACLQPS